MQMIMKRITICFCLARADEWDKKTVVTFSAPVEIPGEISAW